MAVSVWGPEHLNGRGLAVAGKGRYGGGYPETNGEGEYLAVELSKAVNQISEDNVYGFCRNLVGMRWGENRWMVDGIGELFLGALRQVVTWDLVEESIKKKRLAESMALIEADLSGEWVGSNVWRMEKLACV